MSAERLQKILARAGFGGRRAAEALIAAGRVTVNGVPAALGARADAALDRIEVDGRPVTVETRAVTLVLNKPTGYVVTAADERGRPTVYDLLPDAPPDLRYVGRLDFDTSGVLLLTTDGELAHRLTHPRYGVTKTYEVTLEGAVPEAALEALRRGVDIGDARPAAPAEVTRLPGPEPPTRVRLVIHEGRNRQVRRMFDAVGARVFRLRRTAFGPVTLTGLKSGASRPIMAEEERALRRLTGLDATDVVRR